MKKLDAKKTAKYFFDSNNKSSHLDTLVACELLDHPGCSPTDLQESVFGVRRGGSVDASLCRLIELGLITIIEPIKPSPPMRRQIEWTENGKKWLRQVSQ